MMTTDSLLSRLFDGLSEPQIRANIQEGEWFVVHGASQRIDDLRAVPLFTDIGALLRVARALLDAHCANSDGEIIDFTQIRPNMAQRLYALGATLSFPDLERQVPLLDLYIERLAAELGVRRASAGSILFCSPPRVMKALRRHFDAFDGIIVQLHGTKVWHLARNRQVPLPFHSWPLGVGEPRPPGMGYFPPDLTDGAEIEMERVTLMPGSVLCVPRGTWHATSEVGNEGSVSISIYFVTDTWRAVLHHAIADLLSSQLKWRVPALGLLGGGQQREAAIGQLAAMIDELRVQTAALDADRVLDHYLRAVGSPRSSGVKQEG